MHPPRSAQSDNEIHQFACVDCCSRKRRGACGFRPIQHLLKGDGVNGFDEMMIEAGFLRSPPVVFLSPTRQCHDHEITAFGKISHAPRRLESVEQG